MASNASLCDGSDIILGYVTGGIGLLGLPGNLGVMYLTLRSPTLRAQPHFWLIFQLAMADLIFCLNNVLIQSHQTVELFRIDALCAFSGYLEYVSGLASFLVVPAVAVNRYSVFQEKSSRRFEKMFTPRGILAYCICCWLLSGSIFLPFLVTGNVGFEELAICGVKQAGPVLHIYWVLSCAIPILLSYTAVLFCYSHLIKKLNAHRRHANRLHSAVVNESRYLIRMMLWICVLPLMAQMPAVVYKAFLPLLNHPSKWISRVVVAPFPLTSACNPYIIIIVVRPYTKAFKDIFLRDDSQAEKSVVCSMEKQERSGNNSRPEQGILMSELPISDEMDKFDGITV